jgi:hypothetical protein
MSCQLKQVMSDRQRKPGLPRPRREVVNPPLLRTDPLVQSADGPIKLAGHEEARSGQPADKGPLPPMPVAPLPCETVHAPKVVIRQAFNPLRRSALIGHWPDEPDCALSRRQAVGSRQ